MRRTKRQKTALTRRRFLIGIGAGGLVVGGYWLLAPAPALPPWEGGNDGALGPYIRIGTDDRVTISCGRSEMGQGIFTGIATLIAEELGCAWANVSVETGPADPVFKNLVMGKDMLDPHTSETAEPDPSADGWLITRIAKLATQQLTGGSNSTRDAWVSMRETAAVAHHLLLQAAAAQWSVPISTLAAAEGIIRHEASNRQARFGELAAAAARLEPPATVTLKSRDTWTRIGKATARVDTPAKVDGSAVFGIDIRRPGQLYAAVAHCPVVGGTLAGFDDTKAKSMPGVKSVMALGSGVAVIADSTWRSRQALAALTIHWNEGTEAGLDSAAIFDRMGAALTAGAKKVFETGAGGAPLTAPGAKLIEAEYRVPYLAHAPMEPINCTTEVGPDGVDVWVGTQGQTSAQDAAATAAGIPADKVRIHTTYLGGGFGRRAETDMVIEAVTLAKALGKPVQVSWSREEDMQHDTYRPAVLGRMTGTLGPDGMPLAIRHRLAGQSILARLFPPATWMGPDPTQFEGTAHLPYAIPNQIVEVATLDLPVRVGAWRSVGHSFAGFFKECFLDELAAAGGRDPVEFRRRLLAEHPRALAVLDLAASNGGWGSPLAPGEGRGVALHISFASIVAQIVEVAVDPKGGLKIKRVVAAVDCGTVINPNVVEAQIQGAIAYGLSAALYGKITLAKGRVEQANFPDYDVVRLAGMPPVEVHLIGSDGPPGGVGEPGLPPVAPALVNAIFAATGKRIRTLPLVDQGFTV